MPIYSSILQSQPEKQPNQQSARTTRLLLLVTVLLATIIWLFLQPKAKAEPMLSFKPGNDYAADWKRVDSLEEQGLYQSALDLTNAVLVKAKREDNAPQQVRALFYRFKLSAAFEENSEQKAINDIRTELKTAKFPLKPVLHSILADLYWQYYEQHRWEFGQRSKTSGSVSDDIATWDLSLLAEHTIKEYEASLQNADSLQKTSREVYLPVLKAGESSPALRPTLYDFLAHRAIDFYKNEEAGLPRPADQFVVDTAAYFAKAIDFANLTIQSGDSMALKLYAMKHIQELIQFRLKDQANGDALLDVDLKRLELVHSISSHSEKDSLFSEAVSKLAASNPNSSISADAMYVLAKHYRNLGNQYVAGSADANRLYLQKAYTICNETQKRYPQSLGAKNCAILKKEIETPSLDIDVEKIAIPDQVSKARLAWKNIRTLHFRVYATTKNLNDDRSFENEKERINFLNTQTPVKTWMQDLPVDPDFQQHSAEMAMPELKAGFYVLLASPDASFQLDKTIISINDFCVSMLSYVKRDLENGDKEYAVLNRLNGQPLPKVNAQIWMREYNTSNRGYEYKKGGTYTTDANGFITIGAPLSDRDRQFIIEFINGEDHLLSEYTYQYRSYREEKRMRSRTSFFMDRSIYRPGQTIYFKGILLETDGDNSRLLTDKKITVTLYDVNYQKVSSLDLKTNAYGSFSGSFVAPSNGVTGMMRLATESGEQYFSVEEYKRPKFEVTTEPVKGAFRLNEKIELTGTAKTYAGSVVDGASVAYRVVRSVNYPWWMSWKGYFRNGQETEIANGKVTTNDTGGFVIPFTALPDRSVSREGNPTFSYMVYVDVTDPGGETRSTSAIVQVGYAALKLNIDLDEYINLADTLTLPVAVTNLMGTPEAATVNLTIRQLEAPDRIYREPLWINCDRKLYTEEKWRTLFPQDPYGEEHLTRNWKKGATVYSKSFASDKEKQLKIQESRNWKPGVYLVEAITKDKYGEEVKDLHYFTLFNETGKTPPENQNPFWFMPLKTDVQPGQKAILLVGTRLSNVQVLYEIEHQHKIVQRKWMKLSNEQERIEIPVEEKHRGNFAVHFIMVNNNRSWHKDETINVPWPSQALVISSGTMRNKLDPGKPETWKLTVKGPTGDKVMAEMVASMYDASLDAFRSHQWNFDLSRTTFDATGWTSSNLGAVQGGRIYTSEGWYNYGEYQFRKYDELNTFGFEAGNRMYFLRGAISMQAESTTGVSEGNKDVVGKRKYRTVAAPSELDPKVSIPGAISYNVSLEKDEEPPSPSVKTNSEAFDRISGGGDVPSPQIRTNLNETAFFFPHLETDADGNVVIQFTAPEALTRWNFMAFAHTKTLQYGQYNFQIPTQKELMVMPNLPRFLREQDRITVTSKISNLSDADMNGTVELLLFDALTMQPIDSKLGNATTKQSFTAKKGQSTTATWELKIPEGVEAVQYRVVATAGAFSDGEEAALPVLTNRMLVTETLPLPINGGQTKEFRFERLLGSGTAGSTLRNHRLTLEFTSNPAWYAVQALPYLMEYPYECAEQTFSRFYANSIAMHVANSSPKIKAVFESWKTKTPDAFLSNLEKNQELKALVLEETPWVLQAKDESERKRRVGLLFDLNRMSNEQNRCLRQLNELQMSNGGWPWFKGMPDDRYITQHIVTGLGHLDHLGVKQVREDNKTWSMLQQAVRYLDERMREDYEEILKHDKANKDKNHLGYLQIQYLYARSYFKDVELDNRNQEAFQYFLKQSKQYWQTQSRYMQGMLALILYRYDDKVIAGSIMKSLKETALKNEELGMYWKENAGGWYWYQAPIETQALLIEAFDEVAADQTSVDAMRVWLLKNKQTTDWKTTKATAEACYALLLRGTNWLATESDVQIVVGTQTIDPKKQDVAVEAGTGYFKMAWTGNEIKPEMGKIKMTKSGPGVSWGAMYWQYFEQLDKITAAQSPLEIKKQLYKVRNTAAGPVLDAITENTALQPGDKIRVRIELRNDRPLEYVHLKDMRASGVEPVNVLSQYKYQDGLGYYESTRDAATNFFIGYMPKGVHVFEYALVAVHAGDFSNGITTAQCMYAPEFAAHSQGVRVQIKR